jgi:hypothetical protein
MLIRVIIRIRWEQTGIDGIEAAKEVRLPWGSACWARIAQHGWLINDSLDAVGPVSDIVVVDSWGRSSLSWGSLRVHGSGYERK